MVSNPYIWGVTKAQPPTSIVYTFQTEKASFYSSNFTFNHLVNRSIVFGERLNASAISSLEWPSIFIAKKSASLLGRLFRNNSRSISSFKSFVGSYQISPSFNSSNVFIVLELCANPQLSTVLYIPYIGQTKYSRYSHTASTVPYHKLYTWAYVFSPPPYM